MNERIRYKAQVANATWQGYRVVIVGENILGGCNIYYS
jgi:hypothetical protein